MSIPSAVPSAEHCLAVVGPCERDPIAEVSVDVEIAVLVELDDVSRK